MFERLVTAVRLLLGAQYLLGGLNWWVKILPFPSRADPPQDVYKHEIVGPMIRSGWMFDMAMAVEVATGLSLLLGLFVPLMLVVSFLVALMTFLLDAMIWTTFVAWMAGTVTTATMGAKALDAILFGGIVLAMQGFLMIAYLRHYRPMLAARAAASPPAAGAARGPVLALGVVAAALGVWALFEFARFMAAR